MWKQYLGPYARIVGIDNRPECAAYAEHQIEIRIGDQADSAFLDGVCDEFGSPDIVIDDGSHIMEHVNASFTTLYPRLERRGVYLVEDMQTAYWPNYGGGLRRPDTFVERCKGLKAGQDLMYACVTEAGSLVVVGLSGQIYRSTDRGKTFETIKCPVKGHLTGIDILADGRLVAVGDRGAVLVSDDDGASFKKLKHGLTSDMLWCCKAHGDGMVIGGAQGTIFYLAAAEKA